MTDKILKSISKNGHFRAFALDWSYTIKVDTNTGVIICLRRHKNERTFMSRFKRYDKEFKQSLVNLYQTG
jgi:hypothetical protein